MEKQLVTTYSVSFRGVFARNRSVKFTSSSARVLPLGLNGYDLVQAAKEFCGKIQAKRGTVQVTRYDNSEDLGNGLYIIPITQGVIVYSEAV